MKKNGFTLVEILAVVAIIAVLSLIVYPLIANQFKKNQNNISKITRNLLEEAAITYMDSNPNQYAKTNGNVYCVTLSQLVSTGDLTLPLTDTSTGEEIPLFHKIKVTVKNSQYSPNYVGDDSCNSSESLLDTVTPVLTTSYETTAYTMTQATSVAINAIIANNTLANKTIYTVQFGTMGGIVECKNGNTRVNDLGNLPVGTYTLTCTATPNNGKEPKSISPKIIVSPAG